MSYEIKGTVDIMFDYCKIKPNIDEKTIIDSKLNDVVTYLRKTGMKEQAFVIENAYQDTLLSTKLKNVIEGKPIKDDMLSDLKSTALLLDESLTKDTYQTIQKLTGKLQPYDHVLKEKKLSEPDNITVTDDEAWVPLESILHKT